MPDITNLTDLICELRDLLLVAREDAKESHRDAMNSYGAGYDRGFVDALVVALDLITDGRA